MTPRKLIAVSDIIPDEHLSGEFFWYSIPEEMVAISTVRRAFKDAGLDDSVLPKERRPEHVVQEACRRTEHVETNGTRIEIRAEQVLHSNDELVYQITKHVQDKSERVIDHPKALRVTFTKKGRHAGGLKFEPLDTPRREVTDLIEKIRAHVEKNSSKMPGHKLRTILRHYVERVGAENVGGPSGRIYFMPKVNPQVGSSAKFHGKSVDGRKFLSSVADMLAEVYGTPEFHRVPCVNAAEQHDFLRRKFVENCDEDLRAYRDRLIELVKNKREDRAFRRDLVDGLVDQRKAIDARRAKFTAILGDAIGELDTNMKLADQALKQFLDVDSAVAA